MCPKFGKVLKIYIIHKNVLSPPAQSYGATVEKRCGRQTSSRTRTAAGWGLYLQTEGNGSLNRVLIKPGSKTYETLLGFCCQLQFLCPIL